MAPTLLALTFAGVAHAQGTMDFSGAQTLMGTFKTPVYIATRLKLTDLCDEVASAFYQSHIGVGHAILLAKLPAEMQTRGLTACFKEVYTQGADNAARILLPVRSLRFWIETNVLMLLKDAPFDQRNAQLVPSAGSCVDCPKRTGHNKLLFADLGKHNAATPPAIRQRYRRTLRRRSPRNRN